MKTIGITGTYSLEVFLNNYELKVDDETYEELKQLQEQQHWNDLDFAVQGFLEDKHPDIMNLSDGCFECEDDVKFYG